MSEKQLFSIFILEAYKRRLKLTGPKALSLFKKYNVFSFLEEGYDVLHTQSIDYVVSEIQELISTHDTVSR